jgi:putative transposase
VATASSHDGDPERALVAVAQKAHVFGVSTRRVEDLVQALDRSLSRSEVRPDLGAAVDAEVGTFRNRSLQGEKYPYLWLGATDVNVLEAGRVVSVRRSSRPAWRGRVSG